VRWPSTPAAHRREPGGDEGLRRHPARRPRQVPADQRQHRPPQGGDQHPPHAVRQHADDGPGVALPRAREAGLVDWLPWSHTFGGNHNLDLVLRHGGTLYIDEGPAGAGAGGQDPAQPARGAAHAVVQRAARLRDGAARAGGRRRPGARHLRPHAHGVLRRRRAAAGHLGAAGGGGAPRAPASDERRCGSPPAGAAPRPARPSPARTSSSTGPVSSACRCRAGAEVHSQRPEAGAARARRHHLPRLPQRAAPDGAGLRRRGLLPHRRCRRAGRRGRPEAGVVFDGRVAEDFKLTTGTWVSVGTLRIKVVSALAPLAQDVVITGHDQAEACALVFRRRRRASCRRPSCAPHRRGAGRAEARRRRQFAGGRTRAACWPSRPVPTPARSPTRATSTSVRC
jgi:feruloyl-CoA synthase